MLVQAHRSPQQARGRCRPCMPLCDQKRGHLLSERQLDVRGADSARHVSISGEHDPGVRTCCGESNYPQGEVAEAQARAREPR